jgi:hypothetical protein
LSEIGHVDVVVAALDCNYRPLLFGYLLDIDLSTGCVDNLQRSNIHMLVWLTR